MQSVTPAWCYSGPSCYNCTCSMGHPSVYSQPCLNWWTCHLVWTVEDLSLCYHLCSNCRVALEVQYWQDSVSCFLLPHRCTCFLHWSNSRLAVKHALLVAPYARLESEIHQNLCIYEVKTLKKNCCRSKRSENFLKHNQILAKYYLVQIKELRPVVLYPLNYSFYLLIICEHEAHHH